MTTSVAYENYKHTIRSAYNTLRLVSNVTDRSLDFPDFSKLNLPPMQLIKALGVGIRSRLARISENLPREFLDEPRLRTVALNNHTLHIPLLNKQAVEWYENSGIYNFDFMVESFHGMHVGARTIYDIGGHQGVWAAYYSLLCGDNGRVYTFEPSIVNLECSSLLFFLNDIRNVVSVPLGLGDKSGLVKKAESSLLIDFVEHNIGLLRLDQVLWERPDFIKIDIEGYEYELMKAFPNLFDFCKNIHLELHIPHLINRGVDYKEIYGLIPFDRVNVTNFQHGQMTRVSRSDALDGFCSLLITQR